MGEPAPKDATDILGLTGPQFTRAAQARLQRGAGKASAVYRQVMREGRFDPRALGCSPATDAAFRAAFRFDLPAADRIVREETPVGTTAKASLRLHDGLEIECVLLPMGRGRATLCISSQVGCKMGCTFCETGRMGLLRQLSAGEIISQLVVARDVLGWDFNNIVFMGMGEALDNVDTLVQALRIIVDGGGIGIGQERLTVCTVGHVDGLAKLAEAGLKRLNLSFSLNAPTDAQRRRSMPVTRRWPLATVQRALADYRPRANFCLGVNYCLIPGDNDTPQHAADVATFCAPLGRVMINVIPYNPGNAPVGRAPREDEVVAFIGHLRDAGLPVRRRITKGRDVMAACGQLGNVQLRRRHRDGQAERARTAATPPPPAPE